MSHIKRFQINAVDSTGPSWQVVKQVDPPTHASNICPVGLILTMNNHMRWEGIRIFGDKYSFVAYAYEIIRAITYCF